jgi:hypothetical protein
MEGLKANSIEAVKRAGRESSKWFERKKYIETAATGK